MLKKLKEIHLAIYGVWAFFLNSRRVFLPMCWARLHMYKRLSCKLIDAGEWYMIPLDSGMQTPLWDAIEYLVAIRDTDSIPRLKSLLDKYRNMNANDSGTSFTWGGGTVTNLYSPMDYMPQHIQTHIVRSLITLMKNEEARKFATEMLSSNNISSLNDNSIRDLGVLIGRNYAGGQYWCTNSQSQTPLIVPSKCIALQQGYRENSEGKIMEHFLIYARTTDCVIKKTTKYDKYVTIKAVMLRGLNSDCVKAEEIMYTLYEDGSGSAYSNKNAYPLYFIKGKRPRLELIPSTEHLLTVP